MSQNTAVYRVSNTCRQLFGLIGSASIITAALLNIIAKSPSVHPLLQGAILLYFEVVVYGLATLILFIGEYERGPFAGDCEKTLGLGYNTHVKNTTWSWLIASILLSIWVIMQTSGIMFWVSSAHTALVYCVVGALVIEYHVRVS